MGSYLGPPDTEDIDEDIVDHLDAWAQADT